jgi:25S rRNA (cytosine2278-C5)-methyltransferase
MDDNIPDLLAVPPDTDLSESAAYLNGNLIMQDKASCFPAYLLLGNDLDHVGDVIDATASPGNKTTHLAALLAAGNHTIFACERNPARSQILQKMVTMAGTTNVTVLARQDFLALDPEHPRFRNVTHLLLDPSCSGSGILRRQDLPQLSLPDDSKSSSAASQKKRKREAPTSDSALPVETSSEHDNASTLLDETRLSKLSNLQTQIVNHAFKFPAARRITYSTCSTNIKENETVIARALRNPAWSLLARNEQVEGLRSWRHRGMRSEPPALGEHDPTDDGSHLSDGDLAACVRCWRGGEECTMGFFVACFRRVFPNRNVTVSASDDSNEVWSGFSDSE